MGEASAQQLIKLLDRGADRSRAPLLWVGAGLSIPAGYPSLVQLAEQLREASLAALPEGLCAAETIDAFVEHNGRGDLAGTLADILDRKQPLQLHKALMKLPWKAVITTNYDELLEDALKAVERPFLKVTLGDNLDLTARPDLPLYKIHGDIADFQSMVLSGESYALYSRRYGDLLGDLESLLRKHHVVYFGCSMTDPRLIDWLSKLGRGQRAQLMSSFAVMKKENWDSLPEDTRTLLNEAYIKPVFVKDHAEIPQLISLLVKETMAPKQGELKITLSVPTDSKDQWRVVGLDGIQRKIDLPWKDNPGFVDALNTFFKLADAPALEPAERQAIHGHAKLLGETLATAVLSDAERKAILAGGSPDGPPPLVIVESQDDLILSLPWELLYLDGEFLVSQGRIDLARATPALSSNPPYLTKPDRHMSLVVNVSAPEGPTIGHLDHEAESYRINLALHEHIAVHFTELGTVADMVDAICAHEPMGVHFSGHGAPGGLLFENDEGLENMVEIRELLRRIRVKAPGKFPRLMYLASCHGNTPAKPDERQAGSTITAAQLHREGVVQVIGYFGPIVDELSTLAEVEIYRAIARGATTRHAVRNARAALASGSVEFGKRMHRSGAAGQVRDLFPFAWAQLVFYQRGPEHALSLKVPEGFIREQEAGLKRRFIQETDQRRELTTGFIGRRKELHKFRRLYRGGRKVFVFQGLGGLGKSTLAFKALPMLAKENPVLTIWCQELEKEADQARALVDRLSDFGQALFGAQWVNVIQAVDHMKEATQADRFGAFLNTIVGSVNHFALHFENMESLLSGPDNEDPQAFARWRSPAIEAIWRTARKTAGDRLTVLASCRYRNHTFEEDLMHVPEMGPNAIFRLMGWFEGLRRLSLPNRSRLVALIHGHPRAVEYLDDLIRDRLRQWESRYGEWSGAATKDEVKKEWRDMIAPALPRVEERLMLNLLLDKIWERVLDDRCRRMLFRMTVLRRPWDWDLMMKLGETGEDKAAAEKSVEKLRETSLLGELDEKRKAGWVRLFQLHPDTAKFVAARTDRTQAQALRLETCRKVGTYLEKLAATSTDIRDDLDAGHYLFECGAFDRASVLSGFASQTLQGWGRVREGIAVLTPFESKHVLKKLDPQHAGQLLGTLGSAHFRLADVHEAIGYYEQALVIAREIGDRRGEGTALGNLGNAYRALGQVEKAIDYHEQALVISREIGDRRGEGSDLGSLGNAYNALGQVEKAIDYYERALVIHREIGDRRGEGNDLGNLGLAYRALGQVEKAIDYYEQALVIAREIGDRRGEGNDLGNLGLAYRALGQVEKAIDYYEQALVIQREIGDRRGEGNQLGNLGNAYSDLGQVEKAIDYYEQALMIAREIGDRRGEGSRLGNLGIAYSDHGQVEKAKQCLKSALAIGQEIRDPNIASIVSEALKKMDNRKFE